MAFIAQRASTKTVLLAVVSLDTAVGAGIPIVKALHLAADACRDRTMKEALAGIADGIEGGGTLQEASRPFRGYLGDEVCAGLSIGDASGKLPAVLHNLVDVYEYRLEAQRALMKQLAYPICLIFFAMVGLPYIQGFFFTNDSPMVYSLKYAWGLRWMVAYLIGCWYFVILVLSVPVLRRVFGYFFMRLWPIGGLLRRFALARFLDSLSLLLSAGLPNPRAAGYAIQFSNSLFIERKFRSVVAMLREGSTIHEALGSTGIVPDEMVSHIKLAEDVGKVETELHKCAVGLTSGSRHVTTVVISLVEGMFILGIGFLIILGIIPMVSGSAGKLLTNYL